MFVAKLAAPLALAGLVASAPLVEKRATTYDDATILQYALTLEHLEAAFYAQGLDMLAAGKFSGAGYQDFVRQRFTEVAKDETTHVAVLTAGLTAAGAKPVAACTYNFAPYTSDPKSYAALSQILEGVGVSAYLGAAPSIASKAYLALAGSILVVEVEHQTWVRATVNTLDPFPQPFAPYLDFNQVYTLAAPFIKSCPSTNVALPFKPFPSLTTSTKAPYYKGCVLDLAIGSGFNYSGTTYAAFVSATGAKYQQVYPKNGKVQFTVPDGVFGQNYLILTNSKAMNDAATVAGPLILELSSPAQNYDYKTAFTNI